MRSMFDGEVRKHGIRRKVDFNAQNSVNTP